MIVAPKIPGIDGQLRPADLTTIFAEPITWVDANRGALVAGAAHQQRHLGLLERRG
jgi:hypothetical protein